MKLKLDRDMIDLLKASEPFKAFLQSLGEKRNSYVESLVKAPLDNVQSIQVKAQTLEDIINTFKKD